MAKHRNRLCELLDEGALDAATLAKDLLGYLSDDDCAEFARMNDIQLFDEDEYDEDDLRELFAEHWAEHIAARPDDADDIPAKREAFSAYIDSMQRDGKISEELASSVTLED
jgi:hypothetical protein